MADDIVTRLRMQDADYALQEEAADEIERLKSNLRTARIVNDFLGAKLMEGKVDDITTRLNQRAKEWIDLSESATCPDAKIDVEAAAEISRLRDLVTELLPFMLKDVAQGLELGPVPNGYSYSDFSSEEYRWYKRSVYWNERVWNGEFSDFD